MSLPPFLRLNACALLLVLCSSLISCFPNKGQNCSSGNRCGNFSFSYPFGRRHSGCGDQDFQFRCDPIRYHPLLNFGKIDYQILKPYILGNNSINHSILIAINNFQWDKCKLLDNYTQSWWYGSRFFQIARGYTNLTFWRDCNFPKNYTLNMLELSLCDNIWYYSFSREIELNWTICRTHLQLPIRKELLWLNKSINNQTFLQEGFEIIWHLDPYREQNCGACLMSKGICGYNRSTTFLCYCPDGTSHLDRCNDILNALLLVICTIYIHDSAYSDVSKYVKAVDRCSYNGCYGRIAVGKNKYVKSVDRCRYNGCYDRIAGRKNKSAIIIGCSIGGVALTGITLGLLLTFYKKGRNSRSSISKVEKFLKEYAYEMPTRYSASDLKKITKNFAEKLGEGGFGVVYKGKLRNGALVAVKLLDKHRHTETQFMNEVATIGRVHHVNLVRLLGYCFESFTSALVYEYMINGSLEKFIFVEKDDKGRALSREQLHSIALGVARGIGYLHQDCDKRIIHFDIKPHNILLDAEFIPKVSDFGLAKLCRKGDNHISMTAERGTPGYVAPELCDRDLGPVTDKSDVYSFGMLLLEIVGGRKNFDWRVSRTSQIYFPEWAFKLLETGDLGVRLRGAEMEAEDEEKAMKLTKVGLWCIQYNSKDRPCVSSVVQMLEGNGEDVANPPLPFNSSATPENTLLSSTEISCSM